MKIRGVVSKKGVSSGRTRGVASDIPLKLLIFIVTNHALLEPADSAFAEHHTLQVMDFFYYFYFGG